MTQQGSGLSAADLRQRSAIRQLRRNDLPEPPKRPIDDAMEITEKMAANAMITASIEERRTASAKAESERIRAEADLEELRSQARSSGAKGEREFLVGEIQALRTVIEQMRQTSTEDQIRAISGQLDELRATIVATRTESPADAASSLVQAKRTLDEAKELVEVMLPRPAPMPAVSSNETVELVRFRLTLAEKQAERRFITDREERALDRDLQRELKDREIETLREHHERVDRFMSDTAPKVLGLLQQLLGHFAGGQPAAATVTSAAPQMAPLPEGVRQDTCSVCGARILYHESQPTIVCSGCGSTYNITPDEEPLVAPPPGHLT